MTRSFASWFVLIAAGTAMGVTASQGAAARKAPAALTPDQARTCVAIIREGLQDHLCQRGGRVTVKVGRMILSREGGRRLVLITSLEASGGRLDFRGVRIHSAAMKIRNLALDYDKLLSGEFEVVGRPAVEPTLCLERGVIEDILRGHDIRSLQLAFEGEDVLVAGRVPYSMFMVPFRMRGRLAIDEGNVTFKISTLSIKGRPADGRRVREVQAKLKALVPMEEALAELKASSVALKGGQVTVVSGQKLVYACRLTTAPIGD